MVRPVTAIVAALTLSACTAEETPQYVVRLDLEQIAKQTAAREAAPGFETLRGAGPADAPAPHPQAQADDQTVRQPGDAAPR